jgi:hypothetical protein
VPYLVAPRSASKSTDFQEYVRLLRQQGIDLAQAPRVQHPASGRWLHVWDDEKSARRFLKELARRTSDDAWQVEMAGLPIALGPLGPLLVELSRRSDGLLFGLHPLSRMVSRDDDKVAPVFAQPCRQHVIHRRLRGRPAQLLQRDAAAPPSPPVARCGPYTYRRHPVPSPALAISSRLFSSPSVFSGTSCLPLAPPSAIGGRLDLDASHQQEVDVIGGVVHLVNDDRPTVGRGRHEFAPMHGDLPAIGNVEHERSKRLSIVEFAHFFDGHRQ